jgi:hypothetical protein
MPQPTSPKSNPKPLPPWEKVLAAGARLQEILPGAVLVGGTSASLHARHPLSRDADHVLKNLKTDFDKVLAQLESVAGWQTTRINRPVLILGSLDGIETGIRQLIRTAPLETTTLTVKDRQIRIPTSAEILRIKGVLILKRNATRDYLDFAALADHLGPAKTISALKSLDKLYPQPNKASTLQQLQIQLADPQPFDLEETNLKEYKNLVPPWTNWSKVKDMCAKAAIAITEKLARTNPPKKSGSNSPSL